MKGDTGGMLDMAGTNVTLDLFEIGDKNKRANNLEGGT